MEENTSEKMVIIATHDSSDAEMAILPWVMGNAALAMDVPVSMVLQAKGVTLVEKGRYEQVAISGFDPLQKLVDSFIEFGGKVFVCAPFVQTRSITKDMLIESAQLVRAARVVQEVMEAKVVLTY